LFHSKDGIMYSGVLTNGVLQFHVSSVTKVTSPFVVVTGMSCATIPNALNFEGARGGIVVKALRYKPAGRGFDSLWCHWNFSVT